MYLSKPAMKETPDAGLATIQAVVNRIVSLEAQGLGETPRAVALRARLPEGYADNPNLALLALPVPAKKPRIDIKEADGTASLVMPDGRTGSVVEIAQGMKAFQQLIATGQVTVKATVYKNYKDGIGEAEFHAALARAGVDAVPYYLNETEKTATAHLCGAYTGEVIVKGINDKALAEIEPFINARASTKRRDASALKVYNNPLFLCAIALGAPTAN